MKHPPLALTVVLAALLFVAQIGHAATLIDYAFTASNQSPTIVDPLVGHTDLTSSLSPSITLVTSNVAITNTGSANAVVPYDRAAGFTATKASQVTAGTGYIEFTLTPQSGASMTLTGVSLDVASTGSGTSTRGFIVEYSFDSFATSTTAGVANSTLVANQFTNSTFALSTPSGDETNAVTFRLFGFSTTNLTNIDLDNLTVTGVISVPEPRVSSLAAAGLFGFGLLTVARLRRNLSAVPLSQPQTN